MTTSHSPVHAGAVGDGRREPRRRRSRRPASRARAPSPSASGASARRRPSSTSKTSASGISAVATSEATGCARLDIAHHGEDREHAARGVGEREKVRQVKAADHRQVHGARGRAHAGSSDGAAKRQTVAPETRTRSAHRIVIDRAWLPALNTTRLVQAERLVQQHRQAEQVAERRDRARLAAGQVVQLLTRGEAELASADDRAQRGVVRLRWAGSTQCTKRSSRAHDQGLGALPQARAPRPRRFLARVHRRRARAPRRPRPPRESHCSSRALTAVCAHAGAGVPSQNGEVLPIRSSTARRSAARLGYQTER